MLINKQLATTIFVLVLFSTISFTSGQSQGNTISQENAPEVETPNTESSISTFLTNLKAAPLYIYENIDQFYPEIAMLFLVFVYIVNYYIGKTTNYKMAAYWVHQNREVFEQNFSHLGVSNGPGSLIDDESPWEYTFYATGRVNCNYAMTLFDLKKRQDLISAFLLSIIWPRKDKITIEIPINISPPIPMVLAVVKKGMAKKVQSKSYDIKNLCRRLKYESLGSEWVVFGEFDETADYVLSNSIVSMLNKNSDKIQMLSISDQRYHKKLVLKCEMLLADDFINESKNYSNILRGLFYLVDQIVNYKMSQQARQKAEKERHVLETAREKANAERRKEELEQQKEERRKLEEEKKKGLSKEAIRKLEEKEEKREQKKKLRTKYVKMQ